MEFDDQDEVELGLLDLWLMNEEDDKDFDLDDFVAFITESVGKVEEDSSTR